MMMWPEDRDCREGSDEVDHVCSTMALLCGSNPTSIQNPTLSKGPSSPGTRHDEALCYAETLHYGWPGSLMMGCDFVAKTHVAQFRCFQWTAVPSSIRRVLPAEHLQPESG
jgi:hypothetical protein